MPFSSSVTLAAIITSFNNCSKLFFQETTGAYNAINNTGGYGLPSGIDTDDVTTFQILITYNSLGTTAQFDFTVVTNTITVAELTFAGGTPVDILALLSSAVFPFDTTNPFDIYKDYTVDLPVLSEDQVISMAYTITGGGSSYTTTKTILIDCNINSCIKDKYITAGLDTEKYDKAKLAESYLKSALYAAEDGAVANAISFLNKANEVCECNCDC